MDLPRHGKGGLYHPSRSRGVELDLVRLGAAVGAPTLALAIEAELEFLVTYGARLGRGCHGVGG